MFRIGVETLSFQVRKKSINNQVSKRNNQVGKSNLIIGELENTSLTYYIKKTISRKAFYQQKGIALGYDKLNKLKVSI